MLNHYLTLVQAVKSLGKLIGMKVYEVFSQEKDSFVIHFADGYSEEYLQVNMMSGNYSIFQRKNFKKAKSNFSILFKGLAGEVLQDAKIAENNRIITLKFIHSSFVIELFGGAKNNAFLLNKSKKIIEAFNHNKELKQTDYETKISNMPKIEECFNLSIINALTKSDVLLPKPIAENFLQSLNINKSSKLSEIENSIELIDKAKELKNKCINSKEYYLYKSGDGALFSLLPLENYADCEVYCDINQVLAMRFTITKRIEDFDGLYAQIEKKLSRGRNKILSNIRVCDETKALQNRIKDYKLYAELLQSCPNQKEKGLKSISVLDWEGNEISIPLDEKLNIIENSIKYYDKSKNIRLSIGHKDNLKPKFESKLKEYDLLLSELNLVENYKDLIKFKRKIMASDENKMLDIEDKKETKYREFDLEDGYKLYVGKNASSNDELTVRFAKPNDLWMHARGSSGSHTVLRSPTGKEAKPPKYVLQAAASISAYYSKQKNAKYVPVAYTFKKYVHKPKGAAVGAVVMSREEVIMAEPKLPSGVKE